ncbi:MAG: ABC transporter ATP-binding protein [Anaerolineae bacterium]|nr:ABC transporter ATP-binding protein [Anaerolineae bacterium]MCB9107261.1 ABC transporter ATP-binding protein [Anaerolineales bacterium]
MNQPPIVELKNLTKSYTEGKQSRVILDKVNLSFDPGEFILLLGQSGSGKSTLLNLISGIDAPDSGDIFVNGTAINRLSEHQRTLFRREHIGFIFQFFNLIPTLTVTENITLPMQLNGGVNAAKDKEVKAMIERVGLSHRQDAFPDRLSGGEQQRVAILRAVLHNPTVLLADEPTGNLDEETGQTIIELLLELTRQANKTLIMASHNPEYIALADKTYRVTHGSLLPYHPQKAHTE